MDEWGWICVEVKVKTRTSIDVKTTGSNWKGGRNGRRYYTLSLHPLTMCLSLFIHLTMCTCLSLFTPTLYMYLSLYIHNYTHYILYVLSLHFTLLSLFVCVYLLFDFILFFDIFNNNIIIFLYLCHISTSCHRSLYLCQKHWLWIPALKRRRSCCVIWPHTAAVKTKLSDCRDLTTLRSQERERNCVTVGIVHICVVGIVHAYVLICFIKLTPPPCTQLWQYTQL